MEAGSPSRFPFLRTQRQRHFGVVVCALIVLGVAVAIYLLGRLAGDREVKAANNELQQLQNQQQKVIAENTAQAATIADLQTRLKKAQAELDAIMPTQNTYNILPNQSLIVGDGHLTIGLVGSPANQYITININGKQMTTIAGDTINVPIDPATSCRVRVQSFDMFKAVIAATCAVPTSR